MADLDYFVKPADFAAAKTADFDDLWRLRDLDRGRTSASYNVTVPAASPYAVYLGVWVDQTLPTVTVGGVSRTVVEGTTPASGQVAIDRLSGLVTFHSSDAGTVESPVTAVVTGKLAASTVPADFLIRMQANALALVNAVKAEFCITLNWPGFVAATAAGQEKRFTLPSGFTDYDIVAIEVADSEVGMPTGSGTVFAVSDSDKDNSTNEVTLTLASGSRTATRSTTGAFVANGGTRLYAYCKSAADLYHSDVQLLIWVKGRTL